MVGVTQQYLEDRAEWMSRDPHCPGNVIIYFQTARSLMRFAWFDYKLIGSALFLTIAGLEGVLRMHFDAQEETQCHELIDRAVSEGIVSDQTFAVIKPFQKILRKRIEKGKVTYAEMLLSLIRSLRNFHSTENTSCSLRACITRYK